MRSHRQDLVKCVKSVQTHLQHTTTHSPTTHLVRRFLAFLFYFIALIPFSHFTLKALLHDLPENA